MRLLIELDGVHQAVEIGRTGPSATLSDLVSGCGGHELGPDEVLFVDENEHSADTVLNDVLLLEGSRISRAKHARPAPTTGWTAMLAGGLDAGPFVALTKERALVIGRSPQADISIDSPSASWEHATLTLEGEDVRIRDCASTNGTVVDGTSVPVRPAESPDESDGSEDEAESDEDDQESAVPDDESADVEEAQKTPDDPDADSEDEAADDSEDPDEDKASPRGRKKLPRPRLPRRKQPEPPALPPDGTVVHEAAVITIGGATVILRREMSESPAPKPGSLHNVSAASTVPFNRPPRRGRTPEPDPVQPPERKDVAAANKFSIATIVAPLILAFAMVLVLGDPRFALLAALSPILGVGTWLESKHRRTKGLREEDVRFTKAIEDFSDELGEAAVEASRRSHVDSPDPATTLRRAAIPTTSLWERRPGATDFLKLHAGVGDSPWTPPVENRSGGRFDPKIRKAMSASRQPASAVEVDLSGAGVVGIVGEREASLAVARSLIAQATTHTGPADLTVVLCCDRGREENWSWAAWLPHLRRHGGDSGDRWLSDRRSASDEMLRALRDGLDGHPTPAVMLVLDSDVLTEGRNAPARGLLGQGRPVPGSHASGPTHEVSGIVLASAEDQLPAACSVVIRVGEDAAGTVTRPGDLKQVDDVVLAGIRLETAEQGARDLARFDDPELVVPGAALPSLIRLPPLLELDTIDPAAIQELWSTPSGLSTPIGIGEAGEMAIDLVKDGPHGLVGGTTGSGKSEFLRSLVAGLAARNDPTRLTFILIDFKGGAAFKTCERLPHTIGTVSNLDEQLADRAIRALEAEMSYRQRMFAAAGEGIDNLDAYLATKPKEPMPRLLLVVDEFAMLAKDYPDVLTSLVSVGAVGRTLGVHMILATQRPAGVVNDDILANTNLRVALRVQSRDDSTNVIGVPEAAAISRHQQGRAYIKLGQDDITPVQTALVTGRAEDPSVANRLIVDPVLFGRTRRDTQRPKGSTTEADLDLMIDAIVGASEAAGLAKPRPVWPEALGERVQLAAFAPDPAGVNEAADEPLVPAIEGSVVGNRRVEIALSDDPDRQRQITAGWDIDRGNLLLMGIPGSGTSTTLTTIALTMAQQLSPAELDLVILDMGSGDLQGLAKLPHTTGYVGSGAGAREQQVRFLRYLRSEVDRRKAERGKQRRVVILIDGLAALRDEFQDFEGIALLENLFRAYADGPDLGMSFAVCTTRAKSVPPAIDDVTTQKWLFRLADPYDYSAAGIKVHEAPPAVAGRCILSETRLQTHVATPGVDLEDAVAQVATQWHGADRKTDVVGSLPTDISVREMGVPAQATVEPWSLPIGVRESDLQIQQLELFEGEHLMVAGPARSGKSTLLLSLAQVFRSVEGASPTPKVWGAGDRRSPLLNSPLLDRSVGADELSVLLAEARLVEGPLLLLIDDAERFDDADQAITNLITANMPNVRIVAAGRSDDLRSMYSHWTKQIRKARCGVLLQPNVDYDGELLGVTLPRRSPVAMSPGRGYACGAGDMMLVQTATPDTEPSA